MVPIIIVAYFLFSVTQDSTLYEDLLSKGLETWRTAGIFTVSRGAMVGAYSHNSFLATTTYSNSERKL